MSLRDVHVVHDEIPVKTASVADLFSSKRRPSTLPNEIFLPSESGIHHAPGTSNDSVPDIRADDDNESLIDFEQWAHDVQAAGTENQAYMSDDESVTNVIVHKQQEVDHTDSESRVTDIRLEKHAYASSSASATDRVQEMECEYDTPDMIYAKINKQDVRYASTSNLSRAGFNDNNDSYIDSNTTSKKVIHVHDKVQDGSLSESSYKSTEKRLAASNEELHVTTANIEGALYSKVRRLSSGSFNNIASPHLSIYGSSQSIEDHVMSKEFNSLDFNVHDDETLQMKHLSASCDATDVSESDDEDETRSYDISNTYSNETHNFGGKKFEKSQNKGLQNGNSIVRKDELDVKLGGKKFEKSQNKGLRNGKSIVRKDELDVNILEERLHELQERQANIGLQELNTLNKDGHGTCIVLHYNCTIICI